MSRYYCRFCDKSFRVKTSLLRHLREKHVRNEAKYKCDVCKYSTSREDYLQKHKSIHGPNSDYVNSHQSELQRMSLSEDVNSHQSELQRMCLSEDEREKVAKSIAKKVPFDRVLDDIRASVSTDAEERRDLMTRERDLQSIARDYISTAEHDIHYKKRASMYSWIEEMQKTGKNVVFYKAEGSISQEFPLLKKVDFVVIIMNEKQCKMLKQYGEKCVCMDSTCGLDSYSFELTTLLVLDDHNQGFPCTFMYSSRTDFEMLEILLLNVRNVLGEKLKTNIFMSDMTDKFFNAWLTVMEQPKFRLFSTWLVDSAWRQNLCKIKGNKQKQEEVYKGLRTLMEERDQDLFEAMFKNAVMEYKSDSSTAEFGEYFEREYQQTVSNWAYCYREHDSFNTNMHLERMHNAIEHILLKGNKSKRGDITMRALVQFLWEKFIFDQKVALSPKLYAIRQRHISSLKSDVNEVSRSDDFWRIFSKGKKLICEVRKVNETCKCDVKCNECKICIHTYICTCPDSVVKFNMCKHIHLVQKFSNQELPMYNEETICS